MSAVLRAEADSLEWTPVRSSNVAAVAYNPTFARLFVRFKGGKTYAYDQVPKAIYDAFLVSPSKGRFVFYVLREKGTDSAYAVHGPF